MPAGVGAALRIQHGSRSKGRRYAGRLVGAMNLQCYQEILLAVTMDKLLLPVHVQESPSGRARSQSLTTPPKRLRPGFGAIPEIPR